MKRENDLREKVKKKMIIIEFKKKISREKTLTMMQYRIFLSLKNKNTQKLKKMIMRNMIRKAKQIKRVKALLKWNMLVLKKSEMIK